MASKSAVVEMSNHNIPDMVVELTRPYHALVECVCVRLQSVDGEHEYGYNKQEAEDDPRKLIGMERREEDVSERQCERRSQATCIEIMKFDQSSYSLGMRSFVLLHGTQSRG